MAEEMDAVLQCVQTSSARGGAGFAQAHPGGAHKGSMASTTTLAGSGNVLVTGGGLQTTPATAALAGGGYVVAWIATGSNSGVDYSQAAAQRFDASGHPVGAPVVLSQGPAYGVPGLVALADGSFVATWDSRTDPSAPTSYVAQHFDASGNPIGSAVQVNAAPDYDTTFSSQPAALAGGGYLVEWWQDAGAAGAWGPEVQLYNASGAALGGATAIGQNVDGTLYGGGSSIQAAATAATADGGYDAVWCTATAYQPGAGSTQTVYLGHFGASGAASAAPVAVMTDQSSSLLVSGVSTAVLLGSGNVAIATRGVLADGRSELTAQLFDGTGHVLSGARNIVSTTAMLEEKVTALTDGTFLVSWMDSQTYQQSTIQTVYAQRFDASGALLGNQVIVGSSVGLYSHYAVTATPDAGAQFAWDDGRHDGGDILTQHFAPTADTTVPAVVAFSPKQGATVVPLNSDIIVTFSEAIERGTGSIVLHDANGNAAAIYDAATSTNITISGELLTIHPSAPLAANTAYDLDFAPGTLTDLSGNGYAGTTTYGFSTGTAPPPAPAPAPSPDYTLDTSSGVETAVYAGNHAGYTIAPTSSGLTVTGPQGTDQLAGVERVQFADVSVAFDVHGSAGEAYRLYQAAFDRAPDPGGLGFWISGLDHGQALVDVSDDFVTSAEFSSRYGSLDSTHFVDQLYQNVLHRAPDSAGEGYWVGLLDQGDLTRAGTLMYFSESGENQAALIGAIGNGMAYTPYGH